MVLRLERGVNGVEHIKHAAIVRPCGSTQYYSNAHPLCLPHPFPLPLSLICKRLLIIARLHTGISTFLSSSMTESNYRAYPIV